MTSKTTLLLRSVIALLQHVLDRTPQVISPGTRLRRYATPMVLTLLSLAAALPLPAQTLDRFGGREDIKCAAHSHAWHTEKIGDRWWICTPDGHAFFAQDVELVNQTDKIASDKVVSKYGSAQAWSEATLKRLSAWGFNTIGAYAYLMVLPITTDNLFPKDLAGRHVHSIRLPFVGQVRPAMYSMSNPAIYTKDYTHAKFLAEPVKNIFGARSPFYQDYVPPGGVGDYFDTKMQTWLEKDMAQDFIWGVIKSSPYGDFLMGVVGDDGDEMFGFMTGPDFPTVPPGKNNPSLSLLILSESPTQTANSSLGYVYSDTMMHTKKALHDMLVAEYGSVGKLNEAWHSTYTTFDSTGTQITGEAAGSGDGSSLTFSHTLAHPHPARYSVQVLINHVAVGGDTGNGAIYAPDFTGSVNYKTGLLLLAFKPDHAPASGASITVNYVHDGYGVGTGLMDEDMRPSHQAWLGNTWNGLEPISGSALTQMNAGVKKDLDAFLRQTVGWYLKMLRAGIHTQFPGTLIMAELGSWGGVPPAPVLQAAGESIDVFEDDESKGPFNQAELNFITKNYGDRPFMAGIYLAANPDSPFGKPGEPAPEGQSRTQADKGQVYFNTVSSLLHSKNSYGTNAHVGFILWAWMDMWSEMTNWGLVSHLDNAYDGHEDVSASVACSPPLQKYTCGGEPGNYGNYIGKVKEGNALWLSSPPSADQATPQPKSK